MKNSKVQLLIVIGLFILINIITYFTQEQVKVNDGKGWDGNIYFAIAEQIDYGVNPIGPAPYIYRLGTPFLASIISGTELMRGFFVTNLLANFLSTILLFYFLKLYLKNFPVIIILIILFLTHWLCNIRFLYYYPILTDYWGLTFLLLGLILIECLRRNPTTTLISLLSISSLIGIFFREYLFIIPLVALFNNNPISGKKLFYLDFNKFFHNRLFYFIPLVASISGIICVRTIVQVNSSSNFFLEALHWLYTKSLIQYLNGLFTAIGPAVALLLFFHKEVFYFLKNNQSYLILFLFALIMSYAGGSDTERFILWFIPLILLLIGCVIENNLRIMKKVSVISVLVIFQSLSGRIFFPTPQPFPGDSLKFPILTLIGKGNFLDLFAMHAINSFQFALFLEYCSVIGLLLILLSYYSFRQTAIQNFRRSISFFVIIYFILA